MNRRERRAQRTTNPGAYAAGLRSAQTGEIPPEYIRDIQTIAAAMRQWLSDNPGAKLTWHADGDGTTLIIAPLRGDALKWLANSPDAFRMLEDVDASTRHMGTLAMARVALGLVGQLPGPRDEAAS